MKDLWKARQPPTPLDGSASQPASKKRRLEPLETAGDAKRNNKTIKDQTVATLDETKNTFFTSVQKLCQRLVSLRGFDQDASLSFDKDDEDIMDFVAASANLRAATYHIDMLSRFKIKGWLTWRQCFIVRLTLDALEMAGNIIPAVSTTNAIVAGFVVLEAFKVIAGDTRSCATLYTKNKRVASDPDAFSRSLLNAPNQSCAVCQNGFCTLKVDVNATTLGRLVDEVLRSADSGLGLDGEITIEDAQRWAICVYHGWQRFPLTLPQIALRS